MLKIKGILLLIFIALVGCSPDYITKKKVVVQPQPSIKKVSVDKVLVKPLKKAVPLTVLEHKKVSIKAVNRSPVIIKLLADAKNSVKQGELNAAVATLERAVRISSRDAGVFYELAKVRLKQKKWELAENLAKKSELLAEGNNQLKKKNWLLISAIRKEKGDKKGADFAKLKAKKYKL